MASNSLEGPGAAVAVALPGQAPGQRGAGAEPLRLARRLSVTFLAVVAGFTLATVLAWHSATLADEAADSLANNSAPSIEHLAAVRGEARQAQFLLDRYVQERAAGRPASREEVDASLQRVNAEIRTYLALPTFPGEKACWDRLQRASTALNHAVEQALTQAGLGAGEAAQATLRDQVGPASQEAVDAALAAIDFNARNGRQLAESIQRARHGALRLGLGLDLLCAALGALAVLLVQRQLEHYRALHASYTRFLEERSTELEWFASRVAHDIRSPLSAARMALEMLQRAPQEERRAHYLGRALKSLGGAGETVSGLLEFALSGAHPPPGAWCDAAQVIRAVVAELQPAAEAARVELAAEGLAEELTACSAGVLSSLVTNLARNALKYMGEGPARRVRVRSAARGARLRVEVEDTGPGIAPELAHSIFEPYHRAHRGNQPGLGLGLATVKRLVEGHGGQVGLQSSPGAGSTFWFELPAAAEPGPGPRA